MWWHIISNPKVWDIGDIIIISIVVCVFTITLTEM